MRGVRHDVANRHILLLDYGHSLVSVDKRWPNGHANRGEIREPMRDHLEKLGSSWQYVAVLVFVETRAVMMISSGATSVVALLF